jgi:hypothetical protein
VPGGDAVAPGGQRVAELVQQHAEKEQQDEHEGSRLSNRIRRGADA